VTASNAILQKTVCINFRVAEGDFGRPLFTATLQQRDDAVILVDEAVMQINKLAGTDSASETTSRSSKNDLAADAALDLSETIVTQRDSEIGDC
jgi:hypothetical protein